MSTPFKQRIGLYRGLLVSAGALACAIALLQAPDKAGAQTAPAPADHKQFLTRYCQGCHNDRAKTGGMSVQPLKADDLAVNDETWEKILRKLSLGEMPPATAAKPPKESLAEFASWLSSSLDRNAVQHPDPGHATLRRLNRAEYANAVRDLLDLKIDVSGDLPVDDSGLGFDNIADVLSVSPTLMDRYIRVAGKVARTATGLSSRRAVTTDFPIVKDPFSNARASDQLPLDSRGGGAFKFYAPYSGDYVVNVELNQAAGDSIKRLPANHIEAKVRLTAGLHVIGASFPRAMTLEESVLPLTPATLRGQKPKGAAPQVAVNVQVDGARVKQVMVDSYASGMLDTGLPSDQVIFARDIDKMSIMGPLDIKGTSETPSRRRIFICRPSAALSQTACARSILSRIAHQAYRRPLTEADITPLMKMYAEGRQDGDFEHGVEAALELVLVSPSFLFMRESDEGSTPGAAHRISDLELATRLSFFLWSSIPDAPLLAAAEKKQLSKPEILKKQVVRMLADPRAAALTDNFAGQWLYLRRLEFQRPDKTIFPDFDESLRSAMLTETNLFFDSVVHENRSVLDFINADYTYVNQRLAEHYGIPGVHGATFRKVTLDPALHRGGLLGQGSILTVTSYENRTSVVLRGKWILENLLAAPPPAPPPNVPSLDEVANKNLTVRQQMELHRKNPVCASCHSKMDPLGFSLENFDAVGAWRASYAGQPVDASAVLPDGTKFNGPTGLQDTLMARKDQFVDAFTERLMIYALGRGVDAANQPAIRAIRAAAAKDDYRFDDIVLGIVQSVPFTMRRTPNHDDPA